MSFDGVFTHVMVQELKAALEGGRLTKIQQPFAQELVFTIRSHGKNQSLLLSANPTYARVQLTQVKLASPQQPSTLVMTFRKHLTGAILQAVNQIANDRIMVFQFLTRDEFGDPQTFLLCVEIMNRHSNIILVHQATGKIVEAIRHISWQQDRYRELLPQVTYKLPPALKQADPFDQFAREKFLKAQGQAIALASAVELASLLRQTWMGLGKETSQELVTITLQARPDLRSIQRAWQQFFTALRKPQPTISLDSKDRQVFTPLPYQYLQNLEKKSFQYSTLSGMLDVYYADRARQDRVRQQGANILQVVKRDLKKNQTKLQRLQHDLAKTDSAETSRIRGELLTTYLNQVPRGAQSVQLANYYDNNQPLTIPLRPELSPSRNAQRYFKTYQKLKHSVRHLQSQITTTQTEIDYLTGILSQLAYAQPQDIAEMEMELRQQGYLKQKSHRSKPHKTKVRLGEKWSLNDQTEIYIGKNNLQNDYLTTKWADKRYTWLHVKDNPGSHVIIAKFAVTAAELTQAAQAAAYYSRVGRAGAKVAVDYTKVKYVHKPNGAKPGYVIYTHQKTLLVEPQLPKKNLN
ncbi:fibronectin/fibrinogen-binding protein [Lactobacillus sp. DCY120]|uniref:Rqc2 homolog RqcH n=1 Tax=Bombilactobacillus apium TaxID=2675299 RepID=A0A850R5C4_9LACO|nr:NFACT family protein [Bombilactobacillus apium]NVY95802.1 fibronectin/fibrinogen-binding protein [Bombilactobacillus apium]